MSKGVVVLSLVFLLAAGLAAPAGAQELALVSKFIEGPIPSEDPNSPEWRGAEPLEVPLASQVITRVTTADLPQKRSAVRTVVARSLHNGREIAILLEWADPNRNVLIERIDTFRDAAALQFPVKLPPKPDETPLVTMGYEEKRVNIWQWRSEWQEKGRRPAVEDLVAEGFGTLTPKPMQVVHGKGAWVAGKWRAVFTRTMTAADPDGTQFARGTSMPIAYAIWEGGNQEGGSQKSVSTWHRLKIE
jgi:DMSO reductase family type II enzyme heme b subunit